MQDYLLIALYIIYYICAILWGIYSIMWQRAINPKSSGLRLAYVGCLNQLFFPICLLLAIKRFKSNLNIIKRR